jgi:ADP-ribose pyrophosphatase YjhB (NUDIX family)
MNIQAVISTTLAALPSPIHRGLLRIGQRLYLAWLRLGTAPVGCTVIAKNSAGHILLVRHSYRHKGLWTLPSGIVGSGEPPVEAAERELREEVRCVLQKATVVEYEDLVWLGVRYRMYIIGGETDLAPIADMREVEEAAFFPLTDLPSSFEESCRERLERWELRNSMPIKVPAFVRLEYVMEKYALKR